MGWLRYVLEALFQYLHHDRVDRMKGCLILASNGLLVLLKCAIEKFKTFFFTFVLIQPFGETSY